MAAGALALAAMAPAAAKAPPTRIVSINLCADQLALTLADREALLSVTWLARDPRASIMARAAAGVPVNHGLAEEIAPLAPDLVLAGVHTGRTAVAMLKRLGTPVLELDTPSSVAATHAQIREVAAALGRGERGEALVAEMLRAEAALPPPPPGPRPVAAVYRPNGFTVGQGTFVDDLLARAGLRNLAAEERIASYGRLPLELLVLRAPDLLVLNRDDDLEPALSHQALQHPVLSEAFPASRRVTIPPRLWACPGPWSLEAIRRLRAAADPLRRRP